MQEHKHFLSSPPWCDHNLRFQLFFTLQVASKKLMNIPHFHHEVSAQIKNPPHFLALKNINENHLNLELCSNRCLHIFSRNRCGKYTSYIFPLIVFFLTFPWKLLRCEPEKINHRELMFAAPKWKYHSQLGNKNKMLQSVSLNATERASVPATGARS